MTKILEKQTPIITTYPKDANALSILLTEEKARPWIMNSFIQLTSYESQSLSYHDFYYRNCPLIEYQRIKKTNITAAGVTLIDFLINSINNGYYICLIVNVKYIKEYKTDQKDFHDMFIYGYDDTNKIFHISDNFQGKYRDGICTFDEMLSAITNNVKEGYDYMDFRDCIELISYNPDDRAQLELYRIKESLTDFLYSSPTKNWYTMGLLWRDSENLLRTYGMDCYAAIEYHINSELNDYRWKLVFHLMWEHKKMMCLRLKYLKKNYCFNELKNSISGYEEIESLARIALNLALKYSYTKNNSDLNEILKKYKVIQGNEKAVLQDTIQIL